MYGQGQGTLNVWTQSANAQPVLIFTDSGNKGDVWNEMKYTVSSSDEFWVSFIFNFLINEGHRRSRKDCFLMKSENLKSSSCQNRMEWDEMNYGSKDKQIL